MAEMLDHADRREIKERVWHVIKEFMESTNARFDYILALVDFRMANVDRLNLIIILYFDIAN